MGCSVAEKKHLKNQQNVTWPVNCKISNGHKPDNFEAMQLIFSQLFLIHGALIT